MPRFEADSPKKRARTCIVPTCAGQRCTLVHKFPNDNGAEVWRQRIRNPILFGLSLDEIRKKYVVCERHFLRSDYRNAVSRNINTTALPSQHLPPDDGHPADAFNVPDHAMWERDVEEEEEVAAANVRENKIHIPMTVSRLEKVEKLPESKTIKNQMINIKLPNSKDLLKCSAMWLRDQCECAECYDQENCFRKYDIYNAQCCIDPTQPIRLIGNDIVVQWLDGHKSIYSKTEIIAKLNFNDSSSQPTNSRILWNSASIGTKQQPRISLVRLLGDDKWRKRVLGDLKLYGFTVIDGVHTKSDADVALRRLFPSNQNFFTPWQDINKYAPIKWMSDGLYTKYTFHDDLSGIEVIHYMEQSTSNETHFITLADGYHIVNTIQQQDSQLFDALTNMSSPTKGITGGIAFQLELPIIKVDHFGNQVERIRYNAYERDTSQFSNVPAKDYYTNVRRFLKYVNDIRNHLRYSLSPGNLLLINNWRLLTGDLSAESDAQIRHCFLPHSVYKATIHNLDL